MVLTHGELESLVQVKHRSPHTLLGMHPLGDGSGVVVRAFYPNAAEIEAVPVHEKNKPRIKLKKLHDAGVFEGATNDGTKVFAYDLLIKDHQGNKWQTRDPYSFLPTLGEMDLYLFGQGNERRIYDKLGAHIRTIDGITG